MDSTPEGWMDGRGRGSGRGRGRGLRGTTFGSHPPLARANGYMKRRWPCRALGGQRALLFKLARLAYLLYS